mmetsp:Transcript_7480/g.13106  ORF Transcript_7480/g.13106 Transcript_7480/m.13106 type:complete len:477 (+) Transcript_7480:145-1575(+)
MLSNRPPINDADSGPSLAGAAAGAVTPPLPPGAVAPSLPADAVARSLPENSVLIATVLGGRGEDPLFPSRFICPLFGEPPIDAATFDIQDHNGLVSDQVFEYASLFRHIGTLGVGVSVRNVRHPLTSASIHRSNALARVIRVSPEIQERINVERLRQGLSLEDDRPLTQAHRGQYDSTIEISLREETNVDEVLLDASSDDDSGWPSGDDILQILEINETIIENIRSSNELYNSCHPRENVHPSPTTGTTATTVCDADGCYAEPVYYDLKANLDKISKLIHTPALQHALKQSIDHADNGSGYWFSSWDPKKLWPFLFVEHRRFGNGEHDDLVKQYLPLKDIRRFNARVADWCQERADQSLRDHGFCISLEELFQDIREEESGAKLLDLIEEEIQAIIYSEDVMGEKMLAAMPNSFAFMPFNLKLAQLLSPLDAKLVEYRSESGEYSVVVDVERNIVFDNFWYFVEGQTAADCINDSK